ncbi:hypothetical protein POUND7_006229 [Theobroma cacao]
MLEHQRPQLPEQVQYNDVARQRQWEVKLKKTPTFAKLFSSHFHFAHLFHLVSFAISLSLGIIVSSNSHLHIDHLFSFSSLLPLLSPPPLPPPLPPPPPSPFVPHYSSFDSNIWPPFMHKMGDEE